MAESFVIGKNFIKWVTIKTKAIFKKFFVCLQRVAYKNKVFVYFQNLVCLNKSDKQLLDKCWEKFVYILCLCELDYCEFFFLLIWQNRAFVNKRQQKGASMENFFWFSKNILTCTNIGLVVILVKSLNLVLFTSELPTMDIWKIIWIRKSW